MNHMGWSPYIIFLIRGRVKHLQVRIIINDSYFLLHVENFQTPDKIQTNGVNAPNQHHRLPNVFLYKINDKIIVMAT